MEGVSQQNCKQRMKKYEKATIWPDSFFQRQSFSNIINLQLESNPARFYKLVHKVTLSASKFPNWGTKLFVSRKFHSHLLHRV